MTNVQIRQTIEDYIKANGRQNTRRVISKFARELGTSKQRISGNISYMKCVDGTIDIIPNKPNSIMF